MIRSVLTAFAIFLAPILSWATWKIRKINRETATAECEALPFQPKPIPATLVFLRGLGAIERRYLLKQLKAALLTFAFTTWFFAFLLSLPIIVMPHADQWFDRSALVWFMFVRGACKSPEFAGIAIFGSVFLAVLPLRFGPEARYFRTRPVAIGFLFWTRVLCVIVPILLAVVAGAGIAMLILLATHGLVWQHLPARIPRVLGPDDTDVAQDYLNLLATSVPRVFLSLVTSIALLFTTLLAFTTAPVFQGKVRGGAQTAMFPVRSLLLIAGAPLMILIVNLSSVHIPSMLFVYGNLGSPPPYRYVIVPIALSLGFLTLARRFVNHLEV
jgi:hypothetical protein